MRIIGLKRSGNHAIVNWILEQHKQINSDYCFINDVRPNTNPLKNKNGHSDYNDMVDKPKSLFVYSYEDRALKDICSQEFYEKRIEYVGKSLKVYAPLILRDPFNYFASRLKTNRKKGAQWAWGDENKKNRHTQINMWLSYAKEFINKMNIIKDNKIPVDFNLWHESFSYRMILADRLDIEFTDAGREGIYRAGGGSAFNGRRMHNKASDMDINERWKKMVNDDYYISLFTDDIIDMSVKIWGKKKFEKVIDKIKIKRENQTKK